jgi:PAS domain S-box-containing protein
MLGAAATETIAISGGMAAAVLLLREVAPFVFRYLRGRDAALERRRKDIYWRLDQCEEDRRVLHDEVGGMRHQVAQLTLELGRIREHTVAAAVVCDAAGVITAWNHGAELLFRYPRQEAIGQHVSMLMPLREQWAHNVAFATAVEQRQLSAGAVIASRDAYGMRHDGMEIPITIELSVVHVDPMQFGATIRRRMP